MRKGTYAAAGAAAIIAMLGASAPAMAAKVVSVDGVSKTDATKQVEILVVVGKGENEKAAKARALNAQGAKAKKKPPAPPQSNGYTFIGLRWDVLPVKQAYNPSGERAAGAQALANTYPTWSNVSGSTYRIQSNGTTSRCPSIVRECPGAQRNDGFNDVGWARLSNGTLGVTWTTSNPDEADMAINTRYAWTTGCRQQGSAYDLQSVFLHENGHVAGLGHSSDTAAVMYPSYQTARCALGQDDKNGLAALY